LHDVCLRKIAPQTTATRHFSTTYDHITDSITTVSFYISGYLTPPALRHKSYTEPDRHSVLFCSVSSQPTRHTRHILPAASRYCNALFCHTPFNSIPAGQPPPNLSDLPCRPPVGTAMSSSVLPVQFRSGLHPLTDRLPMAVPFYSALFHLGMPDPPDHTRPYQTYPTYPAGRQSVPHCHVLRCPFNPVPACTLLPTDCPWPCHSILLCFIPACPPPIYPTYPAGRQ